jgi:FeS assembly SUF system regulator
MIIIRNFNNLAGFYNRHMFRLNKMTDYAILVLGVLHSRRGQLLSTAQIAEVAQLSQPTVAKLIKMLVGAGLVDTIRGTKGGCQLARLSDQISVADVIEAVEGPIALTACVDNAEDACGVQNGCFMSGNWNHVNSAIHQALDGVSLTNLFDPASLFPIKSDRQKPTPQAEV